MSWKWKETGYGNVTWNDPSGHIFLSYREIAQDTGEEETALKVDGTWFVLLGDWRKQYEEAYNRDGFGALLQVYQENAEFNQTEWSKVTNALESREENAEVKAVELVLKFLGGLRGK